MASGIGSISMHQRNSVATLRQRLVKLRPGVAGPPATATRLQTIFLVLVITSSVAKNIVISININRIRSTSTNNDLLAVLLGWHRLKKAGAN